MNLHTNRDTGYYRYLNSNNNNIKLPPKVSIHPGFEKYCLDLGYHVP